MRQKSAGNDTADLAASKRFGQYKKEEQKPVREPDIKGHDEKKVEQLLEIYQKIRLPDGDIEENDAEYYGMVLKSLRNINCSEFDVSVLCRKLANYQNDFESYIKSGLVLSALINSSRRDGFLINSEENPFLIMLGYNNTKKITVIGDVDGLLGFKMRDGEIHVIGNAEDQLGYRMEGGRIIIDGNAGVEIGFGMHGGEIHVNGELGDCDEGSIYGGKIFHKGKLIVNM